MKRNWTYIILIYNFLIGYNFPTDYARVSGIEPFLWLFIMPKEYGSCSCRLQFELTGGFVLILFEKYVEVPHCISEFK